MRLYSPDEESSLAPSKNISARMLMRIYFSKFFISANKHTTKFSKDKTIHFMISVGLVHSKCTSVVNLLFYL